jgi:hypothetical protein
MLVAAADVGSNNFKNDAMLALPGTDRQLGEVNRLDFHLSGTHIGDAAI